MNKHCLTIAMTAAPRSDQTIAQRCITSAILSGLTPLTIYAEPKTQIASQFGVLLIHRKHRLGEWQNWVQAVMESTRTARSGLLITMQDDILCSRGIAQLVKQMTWPDPKCGVVHLYTSRRYGGITPLGRMSPVPKAALNRMAGACCLAFPVGVAREIAEYGLSCGWRGHTSHIIDTPCDKEGLDTFIGETLAVLGLNIWVCNPSLAFHIGEESTLGHGQSLGNRQAANWPGENAIAGDVIKC